MTNAEILLDEEQVRDNRIVTGWLLYYYERKKDYLRQREVILHSSSASAFSEAPGQPYVSDTTGRKGTKLAELEKTERWLELVEEVERRLPWKMQIILRLRRESKFSRRYKGYWRTYVQRRYAEELAAIMKKDEEDVWVSEEQIRQFWDRIVEYTARLAGKRGLL